MYVEKTQIIVNGLFMLSVVDFFIICPQGEIKESKFMYVEDKRG